MAKELPSQLRHGVDPMVHSMQLRGCLVQSVQEVSHVVSANESVQEV